MKNSLYLLKEKEIEITLNSVNSTKNVTVNLTKAGYTEGKQH